MTANHLDPLMARGWRVLHSIPRPRGGDIDHLAIGPSGVFAINTKHYPGKSVHSELGSLRVDGAERADFLDAVLSEAAEATEVLARSDRIGIQVVPVIAFVRPLAVTGDRTVEEILVVDASHLTEVMEGFHRDRPLTRQQIETLYASARDDRTWRPSPY